MRKLDVLNVYLNYDSDILLILEKLITFILKIHLVRLLNILILYYDFFETKQK